MGDIKLFETKNSKVKELQGKSVALEKSLQVFMEQNLHELLGVKFLETEYTTGKTHGGRIDTLGIDENGCPVIIEYKRSTNENVINQGLFYLDWLMDHKADFKLLVMDKLGKEEAKHIEWSSPRLLCIAGDFKKYDEHAVQQINRNIELIRYKRYGSELLLLELVNATSATPTTVDGDSPTRSARTASEVLHDMSPELRDVYEALKSFMIELGDDVQEKMLKYYVAFKRIKNFACVEPQKKLLYCYLKVDTMAIELKDGYTRDVSSIGHFGTGDLQVTIKNLADLERTKELIIQSYENS